MRTSSFIYNVAMLLVLFFATTSSAPPYPVFPSTGWTLKGLCEVYGQSVPHVMYLDTAGQKITELLSGNIVDASQNGETYWLDQETGKCRSFKTDFPLPQNFFSLNNATFLGHKIVLDDGPDPVNVQHWGVKYIGWPANTYFYANYFILDTPVPPLKIYETDLIGYFPDGTSVKCFYTQWNFTTPDDSFFGLPSGCATTQKF
eukprot:TRINITY_DN369_c0_g1_i1.p1 TRINITY_DN369_c0_g1~~TRINITY_DN369_c0_g1_i1.p1  ORF type:complete len:219 (-),score=38.94 TRINITY_DN369_c0_g1_i1:38-643(-)